MPVSTKFYRKRNICARRKLCVKCLEFSCKRVQSRTCSDYAERSRKSRRRGTTERSDGNRVRSARIGEARTMCLEFSCKRAQSRTCSGYAERSRKSRRRGTTERSDSNRGRSPRICVARMTCLEGTTPQDMPPFPPHNTTSVQQFKSMTLCKFHCHEY